MNTIVRWFATMMEQVRKENARAFKKDAGINSLKNFFNFSTTPKVTLDE